MSFQRLNIVLERILETIPGGIFGLLSVGIGICGDFIAFLLFPGYSFLFNMISDLGIGPGGVFFNIGVIIAGLAAIPYDIHLGKTLYNNQFKKRYSDLAITMSIICCISLSLIGVFPGDESNPPMLLLHGLFALICFLGGVIYLSLFGYMMLSDERFPKYFSYHSFIVAGLFFMVIFTWVPIIEWIANIGIITWTTFIATYMLKKKI